MLPWRAMTWRWGWCRSLEKGRTLCRHEQTPSENSSWLNNFKIIFLFINLANRRFLTFSIWKLEIEITFYGSGKCLGRARVDQVLFNVLLGQNEFVYGGVLMNRSAVERVHRGLMLERERGLSIERLWIDGQRGIELRLGKFLCPFVARVLIVHLMSLAKRFSRICTTYDKRAITDLNRLSNVVPTWVIWMLKTKQIKWAIEYLWPGSS